MMELFKSIFIHKILKRFVVFFFESKNDPVSKLWTYFISEIFILKKKWLILNFWNYWYQFTLIIFLNILCSCLLFQDDFSNRDHNKVAPSFLLVFFTQTVSWSITRCKNKFFFNCKNIKLNNDKLNLLRILSSIMSI